MLMLVFTRISLNGFTFAFRPIAVLNITLSIQWVRCSGARWLQASFGGLITSACIGLTMAARLIGCRSSLIAYLRNGSAKETCWHLGLMVERKHEGCFGR